MKGVAPGPPAAVKALLALLLAGGLLGLGGRVALDRISDHDELWHLATGHLIVETSHVPTTDPFTFTAGDARWVNTNWLAQVVLDVLYRHGGLELDWVLGLLLVFGAVSLVVIRARSHVRSAWPVVAVSFLVLSTLWTGSTVRPQGWTFALLGAALLLADRIRARPRWRHAVVLTLALALAGELHGGFVFVFGAIGIAAVGGAWESWQGRATPRAPAMLLLAIVVAAASFAFHPHGFDALLHPITYARDPRVREIFVVDELRPPDLSSGAGRLTAIWVLSFLALALAGGVRLALAESLGVVAFTLLALRTARGSHYLAIVLAAPWAAAGEAALERAGTLGPAVSRRLVGALSRLEPVASSFVRAVPVVFGLLVVAAAIARPPRPGKPHDMSSPLLGLQRGIDEAAAYLDRASLPGNLFNEMGYGGALAWRRPGHRTFIDGRGDLHAVAGSWHDYATVAQLDPEWGNVLEKWRIDLALVEQRSGIARALAARGWRAAWTFEAPEEPFLDRPILLVRPGSNAAKALGNSKDDQPR